MQATLALPGLRDEVAIVTGGSRGIGAAIVAVLRECGARPAILDLPDCDLLDLERIPGAVAAVEREHGPVGILVNNAGIAVPGSVEEASLEDLDRTLRLNLMAPFALMQAVLPGMVARGRGAVVNVASDQALVGKRFSAAYGASKAGLAQLTRATALDYARHGVRVNAVAPGATDTDMLRAVLADLPRRYPDVYSGDVAEAFRSGIPLGRFGEPLEIARAVAFLASDAASYISGVTLPVDGGFTAQ